MVRINTSSPHRIIPLYGGNLRELIGAQSTSSITVTCARNIRCVYCKVQLTPHSIKISSMMQHEYMFLFFNLSSNVYLNVNLYMTSIQKISKIIFRNASIQIINRQHMWRFNLFRMTLFTFFQMFKVL